MSLNSLIPEHQRYVYLWYDTNKPSRAEKMVMSMYLPYVNVQMLDLNSFQPLVPHVWHKVHLAQKTLIPDNENPLKV